MDWLHEDLNKVQTEVKREFIVWDFRFSWRQAWRLESSGM
jgi:hypothetical protein